MSTPMIREKYPLGWTPSADIVNGDQHGLLRMDNLKLDEIGNLSLQKGNVNIGSGFPGYVHSIFSRQIGGVKHRFVGLEDGTVRHSSDNFASQDTPLTGGTIRARFSGANGSIFMSSLQQRRKFDGVNTWNWGLRTPTNPLSVVANNQPTFDVSNGFDWLGVEGDNFSAGGFAQIDSTSDTLRAIVGTIYSPPSDMTSFPEGAQYMAGDTFSLRVRIGDTNNLVKVRVEFLLGDATLTGGYTDYFWKEWQADVDLQAFVLGVNAYSTLTSLRSAFNRQGSDNDLGWSNVGAARVTFLFTAVTLANVVDKFEWRGGTEGPLTGSYDYIQYNVRDNGVYQARSARSPFMSVPVEVINGNVLINTLPDNVLDPQINHVWLFRRGGQNPDKYLRLCDINLTAGTITFSDGSTAHTSAGQVMDTLSDAAIADADIQCNLSTQSLQDFRDEIFSIVDGMYYNRLVAISSGYVLLSEIGNPDALDLSVELRVSGDTTERNYWITKIAANILLVGTSKNLYQITGTLQSLPDGRIDVLITALGEAHPPISLEFALDSGNVFYMGTDGIRQTNGSASTLLSPQLNLLFRGETRYGISGVNIQSGALIVYPMAIWKGQLYVSTVLLDGSRPIFIYDFLLQYWRLWYTDPISFFVEEDGVFLAGYGNPGDYYLRQMESGNQIWNGATGTGQIIYLQTIQDANGQPRNRKEAQTLKFLMGSGAEAMTVHISGDAGGFVDCGTHLLAGIQDLNIDLYSILTQPYGLGFRFSILLTSGPLHDFKLMRWVLEYDPRPEQLSFLRLQPSNLGTMCRKRFTNFAFVIDTLGNDVFFTPDIDGVPIPAYKDTINHDSKTTYKFYFTDERIGTDIGGTIVAKAPTSTTPGFPSDFSANCFEFYGINLEEIVSEKLPVPVKFLVIPANNYGTPNRKRHSSYKFQILTNGSDVTFIPILDGVSLTPATYNTTVKRTVEYFFPNDTIGIDIGGTLAGSNPFEFYGVITPQDIEVLPPRLTEFRIPENNYGIAAKKRIRTMPMFINTNGTDVIFTPIVDGQSLTPTTINTSHKQTAFHYFATDVFGIDFSGELRSVGNLPFEFYGLLTPENVETLPVSKIYDQIGPVVLDRIGKVIGFRMRGIFFDSEIPWAIYAQDVLIANGVMPTVIGKDVVYEQEWLVKSRNGTVIRMEIGPAANPFNRYYVKLKVNLGGADASSQMKMVTIAEETYRKQ